MGDFKKELTSLLNKYSWDKACETPDHILADYVERCLNNYCSTVAMNIAWHKLEKLEDNTTPKKEEKWKYPSKGELPEKGREVWDGYEIIYYLPDLKKWCRFDDDEPIKTPYAWCYLPDPPEEEE